MSTENFTKIRVGGQEITVPIYRDENLTHQIAQRVNEKLKEIELASPRVDTHRFALIAAFEFAAECQRLRDEYQNEERELAKTFDGIIELLRSILENLRKV